MSRWAKPAPARALGGRPEPEISFSEIKVTRQLRHAHVQHREGGDRVSGGGINPNGPSMGMSAGRGYHYQVCGPHMATFQPALTTIRPSSPHDFPWNRLDQIVCGWDWQLGTGLRLRCKRFALLDYEVTQEDGLRRLTLTLPPSRPFGPATPRGERLQPCAREAATVCDERLQPHVLAGCSPMYGQASLRRAGHAAATLRVAALRPGTSI